MKLNKLANEVAMNMQNNHSVFVSLYFKNGEEQTFYYFKPSCEMTTKQFYSTMSKMNNEWCQSITENGKVGKISITCY